MFKILVVDDDAGMRAALKTILVQGGFLVTEAENGRVARDIIGLDNYDLVISDFQMPEMNGVELLTWIKNNKPTPVILITGFSHILETKQAFDLGAADFINKPFNYKTILQAIQKILKPELIQKAQKVILPLESDYCKIPIEDFVSSAGVQINVYIKLAEDKFVRVAHKGDHIPVERAESYKSKGVTYLYAKKEEYGRLVGFNISPSKMIHNNSAEIIDKKITFMRYSMDLILSNIHVQGISPQAYRQASDCIQLCLSMITDHCDLLEILEGLNKHSNWLYGHCLGVGIYSVMIGRKMGWTAQATMFKLGFAGVLHDLGEKEIDPAVLAKNRPILTFEERKVIESHPSRGKEILQIIREVPDDVIQIIHEHHEDCTGQGFPRHVSKEKIHPLAKVVFVADKFCSYALKTPRSEGCTAQEAIQQMQIHCLYQMDKKIFGALVEQCLN